MEDQLASTLKQMARGEELARQRDTMYSRESFREL